jgi:large subunit ribosomal protein L6
MRIDELKETVNIPDGVEVKVEGNIIIATGQHGQARRSWIEPKVSIWVEGKQVAIGSKNATKKQKRIISTMKSHVQNIIAGVKNNNEYKLKICASHFPMQVVMEGGKLVIKNFFGEKIPRKTELPKEVQIKIQGDRISVSGPDVEKVGEATSIIEQACRIANRDKRVFQDGIFLTEKNGKPI